MATYNHMAVTCTLDRVAPLDEGTDSLGFGLNLSASFVEGADPELEEDSLKLLASWNWKISKAAVWGRPKAGVWKLVDGAVAVLSPQAVADTDPLAEAVRDRISLQAHGDDGNLDPDRLRWDPATPPKPTDGPHHIRNLLAVLSTRAAPVPRKLGLAFLLRIPAAQLTDFDEVAAVPIFDDESALGQRGPRDLATQLPKDEGGQGVFSIEYEAVAAPKPPLKAYLLAALKELETKDFFIDLKTGWARPEAGWAGKDWTVAFEGRAAEAFDLAQRVIDVWRQGLSQPDPDFRKVPLPSLREAVLAAARDRAGLGLETAPDGTGLLPQVKGSFLKTHDAAEWLAVEAALNTFDKGLDLDHWRDLVRATIPETAGIAAAGDSDLPRPAEQLENDLAELDRLQSVLAEDAKLRLLVQAQWRQALASLDARLRDDVLRLVDPLLAAGSPRRLLSHQALGPLWPALVSLDSDPPPVPDEPQRTRDADERKELGLRLAEQLRGAFRARLLKPGSSRKPEISIDARNALEALKGKILDRLDDFSEQLTKDLLPDLGRVQVEGEGSITPVAHGITLQLDRLGTAGDPGKPEEDRKDLQHLLAGCGALMRRKGDGEEAWRCLNMARIRLGAKGPEIAASAPVPFRLGYRNGLRETAVTYDNHPLVADSPAQRLSGDMALVDDAKATGPLLDPLISHGEVESPDGWSLLPALRFGDFYEALPFAVLNSGVLPRGLGKPDDPTVIRDFGSADLPAGSVRTFRYLRRVPVGTPRHAKSENDPRRSELIPIPASVAPVAREVDVPGLTPDEQLPLLLLAPATWPSKRDTFELRLRKPAVDLKTWDRWVSRDAGATGLRKQTWAWVHRNAPKDLGDSITVDLTIDDPATEDALYAELRPVFPSAGEKKTAFVDVQRTLLADFRKDLQSDPASVKIGLGAASVTGAPSKLAVTVPEGEVWELRVHALVEKDLYDDEAKRRIHPDLGTDLKDEVTRGGKTYRLQPAYRLLVEVATDGLKENLQEALWTAITPEVLGARIAVRLDETKIPTFAKWISRAEIRRQVWRWNGRPLGPFPFGKDPDGPEARAWEARAFAEREDADCARSTAAIHLKDPLPLLYEEDRANDARALLYRFGVEVFSRYDGLGVPKRSVRAEHLVEGKVKTPWRRLVHLCRWTEEVPRPRVKLVVPLTEARDRDLPPGAAPATPCGLPAKAGGAAGLLVVLNEPWYEIGGLAEDLRIDLDSVEDPTQEGRELPQIGPDPILTGAPWRGPQKLDFRLDGPIGHTFDTDSSAPLFISTSFVVPAPALADVDLSWHFARVRFRRRLDPAGSAATPANGGESKPTDPFWVQFLPDASSYGIQAVDGAPLPHLGVSDLSIQNPGTGGAFDLMAREGGQRVRIAARAKDVETSASRFIQTLLVTRLIADARGAGEEKYVGLYEFDSSSSSWRALEPGTRLDSGWKLRARVVELQERKETDADKPLWDRFFPQKDGDGRPQDATLRVVRVSPPIDP